MRIALLLRGLAYCDDYFNNNLKKTFIINYKYSLDNYKKNIFENNDVHVFFHTYYTDRLNVDELIKDYKPKDYVITRPEFLDKCLSRDKFRSCLYSLLSVMNLFINYNNKENIKYDYIIITRFDLNFKVKLSELSIEPNKFHINCMTEGDDSTDDNFFIMNYEHFLKYFNILCESQLKYGLHYEYNNILKVIGKPNIKFLFDGHYVIHKGTPLYDILRLSF